MLPSFVPALPPLLLRDRGLLVGLVKVILRPIAPNQWIDDATAPQWSRVRLDGASMDQPFRLKVLRDQYGS